MSQTNANHFEYGLNLLWSGIRSAIGTSPRHEASTLRRPGRPSLRGGFALVRQELETGLTLVEDFEARNSKERTHLHLLAQESLDTALRFLPSLPDTDECDELRDMADRLGRILDGQVPMQAEMHFRDI